MSKLLRTVVQAALILYLASCSLFDYSSTVSKKYALVYGVTRYTLSAPAGVSPNLTYPGSDAVDVAAMLSGAGYTIVQGRWVDGNGNVWVRDQGNATPQLKGQIGSPTVTISGGTPSAIADSGAGSSAAPTKTRIISDIQSLAGIVGPNDVVVVYFSGHGTQDTTVTPPREYIDPYQGVAYYNDLDAPAYSGDYAHLQTSINDSELSTFLAALPTSRKVLIFDTCYSGGFIGNALEVDGAAPSTALLDKVGVLNIVSQAIANYGSFTATPTGLSPYNAQVLAAAGRNESSYETDTLAHGVMTYYLLQTPASADLNGDGAVTVLEAFAYVKAAIDVGWNKEVVAGQKFEPHVSGGPVDFVLF